MQKIRQKSLVFTINKEMSSTYKGRLILGYRISDKDVGMKLTRIKSCSDKAAMHICTHTLLQLLSIMTLIKWVCQRAACIKKSVEERKRVGDKHSNSAV